MINIKSIEVETVYFIETDEPGFEEIIRYGADDWVVKYGGKELGIQNFDELEEQFQKILLLSTIDN